MKFSSLVFLSLAAPASATWGSWDGSWGDKDEPKDETPDYEKDKTCQTYEIDFEGFARGEKITNQLFDDYGVSVSCYNNNKYKQYGCRIFDTAVPVGNWPYSSCQDCGDKDLGSPNYSCGGPGWGDAGKVGQPHENCEALGNVLVVDENGPHYPPDDSIYGGKMIFDFEHPVNTKEICFLDVDGEGKVEDTKVKVSSVAILLHPLPSST